MSTGVIYVHSAPPAICPHAEWAISHVLGTRVSLEWTEQRAAPGQLRARTSWSGAPGAAGKIASALRKWQMLRYEVTEDASPGTDGERICYLPGRGLWRTTTSANGDVMVGESQLLDTMARADGMDDLLWKLSQVLGTDIDAELEPYRRSGEGTAITWLHQVG